MSIVFYYSPMSSASPVAWALAELDLPHETVLVDLKKGEQRKPEMLKLNPNGKVPTMVVDGAPMFEALAIMMHLGDRFGVDKKLWPGLDDPARPVAMAWSVWAYVTYGTTLRHLFMATTDRLGPEFHNAAQAEYAKKEIGSLLGMLDAHLADRPWLLGEAFSLADVIMGGVIGYSVMSGVDLTPHARVADWLARCQARPAFRKAMS